MPEAVPPPDDLDAAVSEVYRGPVEEFVARRDALAGRLRADGLKDEAARVKKLRKPSRQAWALDAAYFAEPVSVERLVAGVAGMIEAQSGRGDARQATAALRDAAQKLAAVAAQAAIEAGHKVDRSTLVPAILAVVADVQALSALRRGQLGDVPAGSDLDVLTAPPDLDVATFTAETAPLAVVPEPDDPAAVRKAEAALADAESAAETARDAAVDAEREATGIKAEVAAAEDSLRQAEADLRSAQARLRDAQRIERATRDTARKADRALATARARLARVSS